jgi:hypothetical protein
MAYDTGGFSHFMDVSEYKTPCAVLSTCTVKQGICGCHSLVSATAVDDVVSQRGQRSPDDA